MKEIWFTAIRVEVVVTDRLLYTEAIGILSDDIGVNNVDNCSVVWIQTHYRICIMKTNSWNSYVLEEESLSE